MGELGDFREFVEGEFIIPFQKDWGSPLNWNYQIN